MSKERKFSRAVRLWALFIGAILILCYGAWRVLPFLDSETHFTSADIAEGYIVRLSPEGKPVAPGWSARVGDTLGLALSGSGFLSRTGRIPITDVNGTTRYVTPPVELISQEYKGDTPWLTGVGFEAIAQIDTSSGFDPGLYFVAGSPNLFFVLNDRTPKQESDCCKTIAILLGTNTFNAYSTTLGRSLYSRPIPVPKVSFYRPLNTVEADQWLPLVRWIETDMPFGEKADLVYLTDREMDHPNILDGVGLLLVIGHPEYWTRSARETFDRFVERGGHAAIAGGNALWWQARYEGKDRSVLVSYKSRAAEDPEAGTPLETTNWFRKRLHYPIIPSIGGDFKRGGYGVFARPRRAKGWDGYIITKRDHPLLRGTALTQHDCLRLYDSAEYDGAPVIGFDRAGLPVPNRRQIGAHKFEILGFDFGFRGGHTLGTMSVMQRRPASGFVLHFGSKDLVRAFAHADTKPWDRSAEAIKKILFNFYELTQNGAEPFSNPIEKAEAAIQFKTPWRKDLPAEVDAFVQTYKETCNAT